MGILNDVYDAADGAAKKRELDKLAKKKAEEAAKQANQKNKADDQSMNLF